MPSIKVIVPVSSDKWNMLLKDFLHHHKSQNTDIEIDNLPDGPPSIESAYDETFAAGPTVLAAEEAEKVGFDGVIIYCGSDPGLRAAKESLAIPVVGIGEASLVLASFLGESVGVITAAHNSFLSARQRHLRDHLRLYRLESKCVSIRSVDIPPENVPSRDELIHKHMLSEMRLLVEDDGADVIAVTCGALLDVPESSSIGTGVPVVIPAIAALKLCELLIGMRLSQSKRSFGAFAATNEEACAPRLQDAQADDRREHRERT